MKRSLSTPRAECITDYTALLTQLPSSSDQVAEVERSLRLLEPRIEEAQKREVGEVVDKLKDLGNSVLGE